MGVVLVYDSSDQQSFDNLDKWLYQIENQADESILKMLVCNKIDISTRVITKEQGEEYATKNKFQYFEVSVKNSVSKSLHLFDY